ncbi:MAG: hypothetical protein FWE23_09830 [Chitinivibrionia bacterium]|nr:hypothetical protein [Chitinivibrionia bacterium]
MKNFRKSINSRAAILLVLSFLLSINVWADIDTPERCHPHRVPCAPQNPGSALILFNSQRSTDNTNRQWDHSIPMMRIFGAALTRDDRFLDDARFSQLFDEHPDLRGVDLGHLPFTGSQMIAQGIPQIDPELTMINVLDIRQQGISPNLRRWADANLRGRDLEIFNELWVAGNPLSFWSQVYDLRYVQMHWIYNANTDLSVITTNENDPRSDLNYFKAHLRDGGGLYIQAAYAEYIHRNRGTIAVVNALTRNNINDQWGNVDEAVVNFWFNNDIRAENFATDFNNLDSLQRQPGMAMRWIRSGGVRHQDLQYAIPLIRNGEQGRAVKMFWDKSGLRDEYENGRFILSFSVSGFRDHPDVGSQGNTITSKTTLATVQNLYDLMSGTQRYTISKRFEHEERGLGETGRVYITVRNPNNFPFQIGDIWDDLSSCLRFTGNASYAFIRHEDGFRTETTATITQTQNGQRLTWRLTGENGHIPARSDWVIEFEYRVDNSNCVGN